MRATIRMKKQSEDWKKATDIRDRLTTQARKQERDRLAVEAREARERGEDVRGFLSSPAGGEGRRRSRSKLREQLLHGGGVWRSDGKIA